jgi:hypothetical protein
MCLGGITVTGDPVEQTAPELLQPPVTSDAGASIAGARLVTFR